MRSVHGISVAGGTFPAQIWNKFMQVAKAELRGLQAADRPDAVVILLRQVFDRRQLCRDTELQREPQGTDGGYGGDTSGGGYKGYDPRLYEIPSQPKPDKTKKPKGNGGGPKRNFHDNGAPSVPLSRRIRAACRRPGSITETLGPCRPHRAWARLRRACCPAAAPGSNVVLATAERSPDWLLGPWQVFGASGADGKLAGPLFYGGLWLAMVSYVVVLAGSRAIGPRLAIGSIVGFHVLFLLAPSVTGRLQLHLVRPARDRPLTQPVHP